MAKPNVKEKISINLALPCYGGLYRSAFVRSMFALMESWRHSNLHLHPSEMNVCDIECARNVLISNFYFNLPQCSHILFIDNDMGFESSLITRMVAQNKEVVGVVAPKRNINMRQLHSNGGLSYEKALSKATDFVVHMQEDRPLSGIKDGFVEVDGVGTGILLISRSCITQMIDKCPDIVEDNPYPSLTAAENLEKVLTPFKKVNGVYMEDISFCYRWTQLCGGKIYANVDSTIQHVGNRSGERPISRSPYRRCISSF